MTVHFIFIIDLDWQVWLQCRSKSWENQQKPKCMWSWLCSILSVGCWLTLYLSIPANLLGIQGVHGNSYHLPVGCTSWGSLTSRTFYKGVKESKWFLCIVRHSFHWGGSIASTIFNSCKKELTLEPKKFSSLFYVMSSTTGISVVCIVVTWCWTSKQRHLRDKRSATKV